MIDLALGDVLGLDLTAGLAVIVALSNVILAAAAVRQLRATNRMEARRVQPVVRARQQLPPPHYSPEIGSRFGIFLTNDGYGKAYNVRYGVRVDGVDYPSGGGRGNRHNLDAGADLPLIVIDVLAYGPSQQEIRARAVPYARYNDVTGKLWETENPTDLQADLVIRPVRFPPLRERLQKWRQWRRHRAERRTLPPGFFETHPWLLPRSRT